MPAPPRAGILLLPATQPNTRGAQKSAPKQTPCYHPSYSKAEIPFPALLSIPATLPARYPLTCAAQSYNPHRRCGLPTTHQNPRTQPSPQLRATLPVAEPPPQHVQTPRKFFLFDNHLPAHLVARIVSICPSNTSPSAIPRYPPAARPSSSTKKYRPTDYSCPIRLPAARSDA